MRTRRRAASIAACVAGALPLVATVVLAANPTVTIDDAVSCMDGSEFCYRPATLTVSAGTTVTVDNGSMASHSLTRCTVSACGSGNTGDGTQSFDTGVLASGSSGQVTLTQPGTYVYYCTIHGYNTMHGSFTVTAASSSSPSPAASASAQPSASASASAPASPSAQPTSAAGAATGSRATPNTGAAPEGRLGALLVVAGLLAFVVRARRRP
jgi:plastocyanin